MMFRKRGHPPLSLRDISPSRGEIVLFPYEAQCVRLISPLEGEMPREGQRGVTLRANDAEFVIPFRHAQSAGSLPCF
jgi:hypothetical protein